MKQHYDIAVVGSGFGGSLMAMIARRLDLSVILLERGKHPRVVIGESSTPLANLLLEKLCRDYELPRVAPLAKWGSWQQTYPTVGCGLKRGFSFFHHSLGSTETNLWDRSKQLLVAASPHNCIADTHWYRADFDQLLMQQTRQMGVDYLDEIEIEAPTYDSDGVAIVCRNSDEEICVHAGFLIDATGARGYLHRALQLEEAPLPGMSSTQGIYSHFTNVAPLQCDAMSPPYPVEDAAVHHVFQGGWVWALRFNNGIVSAGVVAKEEAAARLRLREGEPAWQRLLDLLPALKAQFKDAKAVQPFTYMPQIEFRSKTIVGEKWAMLPSAAGFVDPLLSTGFTLTLLGIARLAEILRDHFETKGIREQLQIYARQTEGDLLAASRLIGALYATMGDFSAFTALTLVYFAAVSFSETAYRLNKPELASTFLLHGDPTFGASVRLLLERAHHLKTHVEATRFTNDVLKAIEPINLGGFGDPARKNWYPVEASDLLRSAAKLDTTQEQLTAMLERAGFWQ